MFVKAWIEKGIINCMSQKCTSDFIKYYPDSEISMCPRIAICKEYEINIKERVFEMKNKLNIGDEIIVRQGENVIGNGEKGKVTGMNIFQGEILYNIELERGFDNGGCLPISTTQVKDGEYELIENLETDNKMTFSIALDLLKQGIKIAREGWNGKGMFLVYQKGYPQGIPCNKQTAEAFGIKEGDLFKCAPYIQMKGADGIAYMWVPSQADMLAEDWVIVE